MESYKESASDRQRELIKEIDDAKRNALHEDDLEPIKDEQDEVTRKFLRSEIGANEYNKQIKALDVQMGVIKRKGIAEYGELFRAIGLTAEEVRETLAHENEHMAESLQLGVDPVYQVQFAQTETEGLAMYPSVNFDFPETTSEEDQRRILSLIIEAPEELSLRDRNQLGED